MGDTFQDKQQEVEEIKRSLTPDQRRDVFRGAVPITFSAFAQVDVLCNSGRPYHSTRNTKKHFVARFTRIFETDLELNSPDGATHALHQHVHPGRKVWRSVAMPRSRTYIDHGSHGTGLTSWGEKLRHAPEAQMIAEGWGKDVEEYRKSLIEEEPPHGSSDPDKWENDLFPEARPGSTAISLPSRWAHDPEVSERGYRFAEHILRDDGSIWFRMTCPCDFRIRELAENEISPILDQLAGAKVDEISVQELLKVLDRPTG